MDAASPWSPLRHPAFRALWLATLVSNVGTWMHDVGAAWLMTSLDPRPTTVALLQAATTIPIFLFAVPAGVLADIVDRRRFLLFANAWMIGAAALLAALAWRGLVGPMELLVMTAALGFGAALNAPAFQAVVPELVPRTDLPQALALNSLAVNGARAIGPALGGAIVAAAGSAAVFALNALSTVAVLAVLWRWRRELPESRLPPEHFLSAIRAGTRYVRAAPMIQRVLLRAFVFFSCASATWALLPLHARGTLGLDAAGYGVLLGCLGAGAVVGALGLPRLRTRLGPDATSGLAKTVFALGAIGLALARSAWQADLAAAVVGGAWITNMTTLNVAAQTSVAGWVKARALAVYLVVFTGTMALGSVGWGLLAEAIGVTGSLIAAGCVQLATVALVPLLPLRGVGELDLSPAVWGDAGLVVTPDDDSGPVLVTIEYRVPVENEEAFGKALVVLARSRRRTGAMSWYHWRDRDDPTLHRESFLVESWAEHVRQHHRATAFDVALRERARALVEPGTEPVVRHFLTWSPRRER